MADETWSGEFYCVKCKEKREAEGKVVTTETGPHDVGPAFAIPAPSDPRFSTGLWIAGAARRCRLREWA